MERAIAGWHVDDDGDWVAELACGHGQHVRHRPPFQERAWVVDQATREARIGAPLDCPLCDRAELPDGLRVVRTTASWDETTMPAALRRAHRVAAGTWGLIRVEEGALRFRAATEPALDVVVSVDSPQPIPPEVDHDVEPLGSVRFCVDFLKR